MKFTKMLMGLALSTALMFSQAPRPQVDVPTPAAQVNVGTPQPQFQVPTSNVVMTTLRIPVIGKGVLDPNDVGNGFYVNLPRVGLNDPALADVMLWLESQGAPRPVAVYVDIMAGGNGQLGSSVIYSKSGPAFFLYQTKDGVLYGHDVLLTFNFPHVTLTELENEFKFGTPNVFKPYPGPRKTLVVVEVNPIGVAWPDNCPVCFRPSDADRDGRFKEGDKYTDATGTYVRFQEGFAFFSHPVWRKQ